MAKSKESWKIYNNVFDSHTMRVLEKIESQGFFEQIVTQIGIGKESNVFLAQKKDGSKVVLKIYRLENCNFKKMYDYLRSDPRYLDLKGRKREIIFKWVQREFRNLHLAREAKVRVPTPYTFVSNVIVMEYIQDQGQPATQLKNSPIDDYQACITDILEQLNLLYTQAKLIHADFSAFNVLIKEQTPYIIDMSQSTDIADLHAQTYIMRDIQNIIQFSQKAGLSLTPAQIYKKITGKQLE
jgi:RIO kinase 1